MHKKALLWVGILISALLLYKAFQGLHLQTVYHALLHANYWWIVPGVAVYFVAVLLRTWRWHYLLRRIKLISVPDLFPVVTIGYMGNNIYVARAGELLRAYVLKRKEGVSISASLATIIVERIFDGLVMLLFVFVTLPFVPMPGNLQNIVVLASMFFFGALLVFLVIAASPDKVQKWYESLVLPRLPERMGESVGGLVERFLTGLHALRSPADLLMVFFTSILVWLAETVKYWLVMHAFPFHVPFYVLMLMNGIVNLATTIPSSPGYVGTFDLPGIEVLTAFGIARALATAYTLVLHAALWLPITLLGAYYMWREQLSWNKVQKEMAEESKSGGEIVSTE